MEKKFNKKGIGFVPRSEVSSDAKLKLDTLIHEKKERINKLVNSYQKSGNLLNQVK